MRRCDLLRRANSNPNDYVNVIVSGWLVLYEISNKQTQITQPLSNILSYIKYISDITTTTTHHNTPQQQHHTTATHHNNNTPQQQHTTTTHHTTTPQRAEVKTHRGSGETMGVSIERDSPSSHNERLPLSRQLGPVAPDATRA
ncbi:hypothetical protein Pmani_030868 [Petrolisthes manimaculis]|uniref:Uncharacterized protein n=1 Tax=Petrolisthes manimaculis TaxID=1843537 RepID=A0AAE1NV24_9EUCA|nr:hypothetical protein Pmani_030868 [Petrolisthes manimaculis]